jgi:hypothetical protein
MLTALCNKLAIDRFMRLKDMVAFLYVEFEVDVNRFSIRRALMLHFEDVFSDGSITTGREVPIYTQ